MECFTVYADEIEGRIDPLYLKNKAIVESPRTKFTLVALGGLLKSKVQYGANEIAIDGSPKQDIRYIRITDIDEFGNLKSEEWKTAQKIEEKYLLNEGDILFARSGATAGKCFLYKNEYGKSIFAGYLIRFIFDISKVDPKYIFYYTQLERYKSWVKSIQRPSGQPNINSEEFKSFKIPLPPLQTQNRIAQLMDNAYEIKKQKETEAQQLIDSFEDILVKEKILKLYKIKQQKIFSINLKDLEGALNPERYANQITYDDSVDWMSINDIGSMCRNTFTPEKTNPDDEYSLMRIDELDNNPTFAVTRNVRGKEINGIILKVQTNDILTARLGPTIENKKIISAPESNLNLIASNEFICFRCDENNNPHFVLNLLKTNFYKEIMIQKTRGATPSRRRLSHEDFGKLPIPKIDIKTQNKIAEEIKARMQKAKQLQKEAKEVLEEAKERAERIILGEEEI